jgi:hypothetical protein
MRNETMHRMIGSQIIFKFGHARMPLIGDFLRSACGYVRLAWMISPKALVCLSISFVVAAACGQGTVVFVNSPTTLVSAGTAGQYALISGLPGSYYFGLLIAPSGASAVSQFTFTDVYATNTATPGRIGPSSYTPWVPGWPIGVTMSFLVAGWSASLGHDWNQQWMNGNFGGVGYFGLSGIGIGFPGGPSG